MIDRHTTRQDGGLRVYSDSLDEASSAEQVRTQFDNTPLQTAQDSPAWVLTDSPRQARGSNDCGIWTCIKQTVYLLALRNGVIPRDIEGRIGLSFCLKDIDETDFGERGRRHILDSLCRRRIQLQDLVVTSLQVTLTAET